MKHILILVEKPDRTNAYKYESWIDYISKIEELTKQNKDFEPLAENILLIQLRNGLGVLPQVFQAISDIEYKYKVFDGEPIWHEEPLDVDTQIP